MTRFALVLACLCIPVPGFTQSAYKNLPKQTDMVQVHRAVTLSSVQGEILMKSADGELVPVANGSLIQPGSTLLVRRGAAFAIGSNFFDVNPKGDRWVYLAPSAGSLQTDSGPFPHKNSPEPRLPSQSTEVDTVPIDRAMTLSRVQGEILIKGPGGGFVPVTNGSLVQPGSMLLVRKGTAFTMGSTIFGAESHGDRWVYLASTSASFEANATPYPNPGSLRRQAQEQPQRQTSEVVVWTEANSSKTISGLQGEALMVSAGGVLVPVANGSVVVPGHTLLLRRGASFYLGRFFAPKAEGDHRVVIAGSGSTISSGFRSDGMPTVRP